jgi:hypothetical protein
LVTVRTFICVLGEADVEINTLLILTTGAIQASLFSSLHRVQPAGHRVCCGVIERILNHAVLPGEPQTQSFEVLPSEALEGEQLRTSGDGRINMLRHDQRMQSRWRTTVARWPTMDDLLTSSPCLWLSWH